MIGLARRFILNEIKRILGIGPTACKSSKGSDPRGPRLVQAPKESTPLWFPVQYSPVKAKDPELARLLRETIRGVRTIDSEAKCVLLGPTLLGWYHTGSQLPWKKEIHLLILTHKPLRSFQSPLARTLGECHLENPRSSELVFYHTTSVSDRSEIRIVLHHHSMDVDVSQIKLTVIDDGTGVYVPSKVDDALIKWYGEENKTSLLKKPPAPPHWVWNQDTKEYVHVGTFQRLVHFPVTKTNMVVGILLLVTLCVLFLVLVAGIDTFAGMFSRTGTAKHRRRH